MKRKEDHELRKNILYSEYWSRGKFPQHAQRGILVITAPRLVPCDKWSPTQMKIDDITRIFFLNFVFHRSIKWRTNQICQAVPNWNMFIFSGANVN